MDYIKELKKLGLKDKEAAVYVACLELGSASAQDISRKARVVRATTYVVLESLMERGLITKYKKGKKTLFSAEPPRQLLRLLEKKREELEEKTEELEEMLPELQMIMKMGDEKPSVRYFEGKEGLHAMRQEIVMYSKEGDVVCNFTPSDYLNAVFPDNEKTFYNQRVAKKIYSKTIFTTRSAAFKEMLLSRPQLKMSERRFINPKMFPSTSGMTIFQDRIAIGSFTGKLMGVIIESKPMADMMRRLFDLAWIGAEVVERNEAGKAKKSDSSLS